jgi:hypothetical protein
MRVLLSGNCENCGKNTLYRLFNVNEYKSSVSYYKDYFMNNNIEEDGQSNIILGLLKYLKEDNSDYKFFKNFTKTKIEHEHSIYVSRNPLISTYLTHLLNGNIVIKSDNKEDGCLSVNHEQLMTSPQTVITKICQHIGLKEREVVIVKKNYNKYLLKCEYNLIIAKGSEDLYNYIHKQIKDEYGDYKYIKYNSLLNSVDRC